jgi:hypothetical protein
MDRGEKVFYETSFTLREGDKIKLNYQHTPEDDDRYQAASIFSIYNTTSGEVVFSNAKLERQDGSDSHVDYVQKDTEITEESDYPNHYRAPKDGEYNLVWGYFPMSSVGEIEPIELSVSRSGDEVRRHRPVSVDDLILGFLNYINTGWRPVDLDETRDLADPFRAWGSGGLSSRNMQTLIPGLELYWQRVVDSFDDSSDKTKSNLQLAITRSRFAFAMGTIIEMYDELLENIVQVATSALMAKFSITAESHREIIYNAISNGINDTLQVTLGSPYSLSDVSNTTISATIWLLGSIDLSVVPSLNNYGISIPLRVRGDFESIYPRRFRVIEIVQHEQNPIVE